MSSSPPADSLSLEAPAYRPASVVRDVDAGANLQALLVSAVTAVLVTRLYLSMTGYPRVGSGPLHIAHLL